MFVPFLGNLVSGPLDPYCGIFKFVCQLCFQQLPIGPILRTFPDDIRIRVKIAREPLQAVIVVTPFGVRVEAAVDRFLKLADPDVKVLAFVVGGKVLYAERLAVSLGTLSIESIVIVWIVFLL